MPIHHQHQYEQEEEVDDDEFSGSENDDGFSEDMKALKQACFRTGTNLNDLQIAAAVNNDQPFTPDAVASAVPVVSDSEDGLELFRSIRGRLALSEDICEPLSTEPLCTLLPSSDCDDEDDLQTLCNIQRRFSSYSTNDTWKNSTEDQMEKTEPIYTTIMTVEDATHNASCENFRNYERGGTIAHLSCDNVEMQHVVTIQLEQSDAKELCTLKDKSLRFPQSAQLLIDAIKKNRSYQKFIRSRLTQIEVKIEENKKLKERVKVLKGFQASCKKMTSRELSMNKDPRFQLISAIKSRNSQDPTINDVKVRADCGPPENSSATNYRISLRRFPLTFHQKDWSREEKNLEKGITQQFQERVLQVSMDLLSSDGSSGDGNNLDEIFATVKDLEITPERIREFLPKVNWDQLASMYVKGCSGAECQTRWLNHEDPLINHNEWTTEEDDNLKFIVEEERISNWFHIAVLLGSNRTPFQCLARYQSSLNAFILKSEWTKEEDDQLRLAVEKFGESDWQLVASTLDRRTGTQCSNRWNKSLHPTRQRVGRWEPLEDKFLKVAFNFLPKKWRKMAEFVPGRTQDQCRERWQNVLDPGLSSGPWTEEEDLRLEAAVKEHGYCWSKVATYVRSRTDNRCSWRWRKLLKEARGGGKATGGSNSVDGESERPSLSRNDFNVSLTVSTSTSEPENTDHPSKEKRKQRGRRPKSEKQNDAALCKGAQACGVEFPGMTNENEVDVPNGLENAGANKQRNPCLENDNCSEPAQDVCIPKKRKRKLASGSKNCIEPAKHAPIRKKRRKSAIGHSVLAGAADGTQVMQRSGAEVDNGPGVDEYDYHRKKSNGTPVSNKERSLNHQCGSGRSDELGNDSDDGITLASFLHNKSNKSIPSLAADEDGDGDGDEMTLSCLVRSIKSKKGSRRQLVKNAHLSVLKEHSSTVMPDCGDKVPRLNEVVLDPKKKKAK